MTIQIGLANFKINKASKNYLKPKTYSMNTKYLILLFFVFFILRSIYYLYKVKQIKKYKLLYLNYINVNRDFDFLQHKPQILSLFHEAKLNDFTFTHLEEIAFGKYLQHDLSGFDNISNTRSDIVSAIRCKFEEAIGIFRFNFHQSYNPIFWIEFVLKFPEKLFSYVEINLPNSVMKTIQLLFWIAGLLIFFDKFKIINIASWF